MATSNVNVNSSSWTSVLAGSRKAYISLFGNSNIEFAFNASTPASTFRGHILAPNKSEYVDVKTGESLYVRCLPGVVGAACNNKLVIS